MYEFDLVLLLLQQMCVFLVIAWLMSKTRLFIPLMQVTVRLPHKLLCYVTFSIFCILGTYFGLHIEDSIANTRAIGAVMGGLLGGPVVGGLVGLTGGLHRYSMGGMTALSCMISTIVEGLLGADLVGFHLPGGAQNFLYLARALGGHQASRGTVGVRSKFGVVQVGFRTVRVGAFPISIDSGDLDQQSRKRSIRTRAKQIRKELGDPKHILLGVDRLDYTKGIDVRLDALYELLQENRIDPRTTVFVQLATPSRERVESYVRLRGQIEQCVSRINGEFAEVGQPVVQYIHRPMARDELIAFYVAADVMLVTPLRDGMNLVAKEYVACRSDLGGAMVLSEFTGAAAELRQAYLCNPHDLDNVKDAIDNAMFQGREEGRRRMRAMRRQVLSHDVDLWAKAFLDALATTGVSGSALVSPSDMESPDAIQVPPPN
jgi:trehalose 6-phosphate synthase